MKNRMKSFIIHIVYAIPLNALREAIRDNDMTALFRAIGSRDATHKDEIVEYLKQHNVIMIHEQNEKMVGRMCSIGESHSDGRTLKVDNYAISSGKGLDSTISFNIVSNDGRERTSFEITGNLKQNFCGGIYTTINGEQYAIQVQLCENKEE